MSKWYVYVNNEVQGPYEKEKLAGEITPDIQVCPAGSEDWQKAGEMDELKSIFKDTKEEKTPSPPQPEPQTENKKTTETAGSSGTELEERPDQPTLKDLHMISKQATDEDLNREYENFWDSYDRAEKRIIRNEMMDRNIWPEDETPEEEQSVI